MYLFDTNVVSELRKGGRANSGVAAFFATLAPEDIYLSVLTIGEIRRGLENVRGRGDEEQAGRLERWLDVMVSDYADRILDFDIECAQVWGKLMAPSSQHPIDKQIAATALIYDLAVVTRNVEDFKPTGIRILNPFN